MSHIIEITPELNRRVELRRLSDKSYRQKATQFDLMVADLRFKFAFWQKKLEDERATEERRALLWYYEGQMHLASELLFYANEQPTCSCSICRKVGQK